MRKFPMERGGLEYLVVVMDYFSKWIEVKALAFPIEENVLNFFHDQVLCKYSVLRVVITDHDI